MSPPSDRAAMDAPTAAHVTIDHAGGLPDAAVDSIVECFRRHVAASPGGMAFALSRNGTPLLRLYGGATARDGDDPWTESTLAVLFSGTKGVVAALAALLVDRGVLDPYARVGAYWPEFDTAGKAGVRLHHVLCHTVGLIYVDPAPEGEESLDNELMARRLAQQEPLWKPGTKVAYHALTYGYLMTEIIRRVTGKGVGELVRTELAEPHNLDLYLGLPESEEPRVATIFRADDYRISTFLEDDPERRAIVNRMYGQTLLGNELAVNGRAHHAAELAAGGAIGTVDAMAKMYALLACEQPIVSPETLALFTRTWSEGTDAINDRPIRFGLGYELDDPIGTYGPVRPAFGHSGAGGGLHGAWPQHQLSFSFLPNEMRSEDVDRRVKDLLAAVSDSLQLG